MGCEMESNQSEDTEIVLSSMWPENINEAGRQFNVEKPGADQDMLAEVTINEEPTIVDFKRLLDLTNYSEQGSSQLAYLVKNWEYKQANAVRLLREELDNLCQQQQAVELKKLEILEEHRFEQDGYGGDKHPISILDENLRYFYQDAPRRKNLRAMHLEKLLEASLQRERVLRDKLLESIENLERQSSPVEELSQVLKRADNFLHFILQNAPVVIGHQDKELRYRFIYNHFPSLREEAGETIGINYMGMEVTDQVRKREKIIKLREEMAVQRAKEKELYKTIHITEETMRAKQMLATMSHEIRSPLSGVLSIADILSATKLDKEQRQLLEVMLSSGDMVLQLINDILDLSKVESGVMKLEATKFRPREVVRHVLQTAAASLQKSLTLEGYVSDDVPVEVVGDVLRIRQIITNLISNAIKFTHEGKVGIKLYVIPEPHDAIKQVTDQNISSDQSPVSVNTNKEDKCITIGVHESHSNCEETIVWIRCDVYDTGIGIPENAISNLFKKYMQVGADTARKYGGTGLGLAICKQLVELMGGQLTVSSKEHCGSTFTFVLPYKVSPASDSSDDPDEVSDMTNHDISDDSNDDDFHSGIFLFEPRILGSLVSSQGSGRHPKLSPSSYGFNASHKCNGTSEDSVSPYSNSTHKEANSDEDVCSVAGVMEMSEPGTSSQHSSDSSNLSTLAKHTRIRSEVNDIFHSHVHSTSSFRTRNQVDETLETISSRVTCPTHDQPIKSFNCTPINIPEIPKAELKPKILLVEDNKINVMVAKSMMKQLGHNIDVVNNGVEAVRAVQCNIYNLVLMVCIKEIEHILTIVPY
ncbi:histidine kinase 5 [Olea europaea subsp. europaea]|uniref:histidine kinase n=1 Tax=Olea europaea subsp. europaea TaxID=158383 RepID=A0A8S0UIV4_OLEEU|nr:histidine kinase 5 [Olea europaea subsp. europaea]